MSFMAMAFVVSVGSATAQSLATGAATQDDSATVWNRFAERVMALHEKRIAGKRIQQSETYGGYRGMPKFYREVVYRDAESQRVLSRIQWETEHPDRVHGIEVYIYDANGRLARDYMVWYLPNRRSAPRATAINLYHYGDGVRGWRQFDASDVRTYERCDEWKNGKSQRTLIDLAEDNLDAALADPKSLAQDATYQKCFAALPTSAGSYLDPH
jgi:hypothetical protein